MYLNIWDSLAWKRLFCVTQFDMIPPLLCFGREKEWPLLFLWGRRIFSDWMHSFCLFLLLKAVLKTDYLSPNSGDMWFDFIVWSWRYVLHVSFIVYCWFSLTWSAAMFFNRNKRESLGTNRTQFPEDLSATPRWLPFLCLGLSSWSLWRHLKTNDTLLYL